MDDEVTYEGRATEDYGGHPQHYWKAYGVHMISWIPVGAGGTKVAVSPRHTPPRSIEGKGITQRAKELVMPLAIAMHTLGD